MYGSAGAAARSWPPSAPRRRARRSSRAAARRGGPRWRGCGSRARTSGRARAGAGRGGSGSRPAPTRRARRWARRAGGCAARGSGRGRSTPAGAGRRRAGAGTGSGSPGRARPRRAPARSAGPPRRAARARGWRAARSAPGPPCGAGGATRTGPGRPSGRRARTPASRCASWVWPATVIRPAAGATRPAIARSTVVFPRPGLPDQTERGALGDPERNVADGVDARRCPARRRRGAPRPPGSPAPPGTGSRRRPVPPRGVPLEDRQLGHRLVDARQRAQEPLGVGVARGREVAGPGRSRRSAPRT